MPARRQRTRRVVAAANAAVALIVAVLESIGTSLVPDGWTRHHAVVALIAFGVFALALVALSAWSVEKPETVPPPTGVDDQPDEVLTSRDGQIVVGEIPGRPLAFVSRPEVRRLADSSAEADRIAVVSTLSGGRGSGKTQIAAEHARNAIANGVGLVAWINAESEPTLLHGMTMVAERLGIATSAHDSAQTAARLRDVLASRKSFSVLVFDNAADPGLLRKYLPAAGTVHCVVTSVDRAFGSLGTEMVIAPFERAQSTSYLERRTGLSDPKGADAVAQALGDLPLALAQAATVIAMRGLSYRRYLKALDAFPLRRMLPRDRGDAYPRAVAAAILLTVETVERSDPSGSASRVLQAIAVLAEDGVHRATLGRVADAGGNWLDEAVGRLARASLVVWTADRESVVMHRLVSRTIRDRLERATELDQVIGDAADRLRPLMVDQERAWQARSAAAEIVRHALTLWQLSVRAVERQDAPKQTLSARWPLCRWALTHLLLNFGGAEALPWADAASRSLRGILGPTDPLTLDARNFLAWTHETIGDLATAIPMFEVNVADARQVLGERHPDALMAAHGLATAYVRARRGSDTIPVLRQTIDAWEALNGPQHRRTLEALGLLAEAYADTGDLRRAVELSTQTVAGRAAVLGPEHPDTLVARSHLARFTRDRGHPDRAVTLIEELLPSSEQAQGADHPDAVMARIELAQTYVRDGKADQAITLLESCVEENEENLGSDHLLTLHARRVLGTALLETNLLDRGLPVLRDVVADCRRVLQEDHPETLTAVCDLATALSEAGDVPQAIALLTENIERSTRTLGRLHAHTTMARVHLAASYARTNQPQEAIRELEDLVAEHERSGRRADPPVINARMNLGALHLALGHARRAVVVLKHASRDADDILGKHSEISAAARRLLRQAQRARRQDKRPGP